MSSDDLARRLQGAAAASPIKVELPAGVVELVVHRSITIPSGVTLRGTRRSGGTTVRLRTATTPPPGPLLIMAGTAPRLEGVRLERVTDAGVVLLGLGAGTGATLREVTLDCGRPRLASSCHGIQLIAGAGQVTLNPRLDQVQVTNSDYGLFQASNTMGEVKGLAIVRSQFRNNAATDVELNAPNSTMREVEISDSTFADNKATTEAAGWAIGIASVDGARVSHNTVTGYALSGIHVEDSSTDVAIEGNTFRDTGTRPLDYQSDLIVLSGATRVRIAGNTFEHTTPPGRRSVAVWVGHGGGRWPSDITVENNQDIGGAGRPFVGEYGVLRLTARNNVSR